MTTRSLRFMVFLPLLLAACSSPQPKREPSFAPVAPADLKPPPQSSGGIYQAGYDMRLFEDHTARRVGDLLTVILAERTQSQKAADNKDSKADKFTFNIPSIFGFAAALFTSDGNDKKVPGAKNISMDATRSFEGKGKLDQSNQLNGAISVTVVEVLPNGYLKIRGEKRVTLNQGDEFIRLSGIVRPVDITPSNTIDSSRIADATFTYTGEGATADANTHGWFSRILSSPWFPF